MADLGINKLNPVQAVRVETKGVNKEPEKKQKQSTVKKVAMAGLAAAGAIGIALLAIKKGNANAVKEIGIDAFKEAGNSFVKGKAITAEGQPFSGIVNTIGKDGSKHSLEYVNGVLKESVKSKPVNIGGKTEYMQVSKKGYNYNAEGKLETVDNFSRAHVTSKEPSQSGLQYIKTKTVNIEAQKAEGLERHAKKQAEAAKQEAEARAAQRAEARAQKHAQEKAQRKAQNQQYVKDLKTHLHQKPEQSPEIMDARLGQKSMPADVRAEQQKFYTEMEEKAATEARLAAQKAEIEAKELARKQAKREEMLKLKEENPAEYKRLQVERKKARHAEHVAQRTRTVTPNENPDIDFKRVINETSEGRVIREYSLDNNTLLREYRVDKYGDRLNTVSYAGDTKIVTGYNKKGDTIEKMFVKNDKGEYELLRRVKYNAAEPYKGVKTVERLEDGTTMITTESEYTKNIVFRDKKGNILSEQNISKGERFDPPVKLKAPWLNHYEQLCKKFNCDPLSYEVGAADHYLELCLRDNKTTYRTISDLYIGSEQLNQSINNGLQYVFA